MGSSKYNKKKMKAYEAEAKSRWGETEAYKEYEQKSKNWKSEDMDSMTQEFMGLFAEFGAMMDLDPSSEKVQAQVAKLQNYITEHFYTCTPEILLCLGQMYTADEAFTENIDKAGGLGTAAFTSKAIEVYCDK